MANPLPLLLGIGAVALLLGGKKKSGGGGVSAKAPDYDPKTFTGLAPGKPVPRPPRTPEVMD